MIQISAELERSWKNAWEGVGAQGDGHSTRDDLLSRYSESHRSYHVVQHLRECIATFSLLRSVANQPSAVELALWFHDAFYDNDGNNEKRSAEMAVRVLRKAKVSESLVTLVRTLIMSTQHDVSPVSIDEQVMVDVDLAILGAQEIRFAEYEQQIRQEYSHIAIEQFRTGRKNLLESFLRRPRIYSTEVMFDRLENQARRNLVNAIQALSI